VASAARWHTLARVARARLDEGLRPLLVCSAVAGVTDLLELLLREAAAGRPGPVLEQLRQRHQELARELDVSFAELVGPEFAELERLALGISLLGEASPRLQARVLACGELFATLLGAEFLRRQGLPTSWVDARHYLVSEPAPGTLEARRYLAASCHFERDPELARDLSALQPVVLTQGFLCRDPQGSTALLGRGGSDTSAALFAARLGAVRCEIWSDVPGLYTADPRRVPGARLLLQLDYDEAQELASAGARALHPGCLPPLRRWGIPLHLKWTERPEVVGTIISRLPSGEARVKAISARGGITLVSMESQGMWQQVGFLADVFACFARRGLSVDLVSTSESNVTVSLDPLPGGLEESTLEALLADLSPYCRAQALGPCAVVSLVGRSIRAILHQLGPALEVFEEQPVYLVSQAASDLNLTFVVDEDQAERLVRQLHGQLFAHRPADGVLGPTWRELQSPRGEEARAAPAWWRHRRPELLEVAGQGCPVYVYDEETLERSVAELRQITSVDRLFYAVKANPHRRILTKLHELGLGFECVSGGELRLVRQLFPDLEPERLLFTPNFAPRAEYEEALAAGVMLTLDSLYPLAAWPELWAGREVFLRLDPGRGRGHHPHVRTAGVQSKFGIPARDLEEELPPLLERTGVRVTGLHCHLGSGIQRPQSWPEVALFLASMAEGLPEVRVLNLGGGLGVPEKPGQAPLDLDQIEAGLARFRAAHPRFSLWLEPGRYVVAACGVLLTRVTQLKTKGDTLYVGVDAGMNSLIRPALYGAYHEILNLTRLDEPLCQTAAVVGPICETGDTFGHARRLPQTVEGDVLLIATAGAYGRSMSSEYNLRPPAREHYLPARAGR
jgi:diaminopimelate decarboxylase/aspartate kinase